MKKDQKKPVIQESAEREILPFIEESGEKKKEIKRPEMKKLPEQKPKIFRLDLDEKQAKQVHDFIHNNFIGFVADPIIEKFRLKNPPVSMSPKELQEALKWLDFENIGRTRTAVFQTIQKFFKEDLQEEESSENQTAKSN